MSAENINRRNFLKKSVIASAGAALGVSLEEKALLANTTNKAAVKLPGGAVKGLPVGKIGNVKMSRLIAGGNLVNGYAHARDLIYVSSLIKSYATDEKIMETWQLCEENGINTVILNNQTVDLKAIKLLNKYWNERGGKIQWLAQVWPKPDDLTTNIKMAIDHGATGIFILGGVGDRWLKAGRVDLLGKVIDFIKQNGIIAGMGAHLLEVPIAVEKAGIDPDFYFKTLNSANYWTAGPRLVDDETWTPQPEKGVVLEYEERITEKENMWASTPQQTIEFMKKVNKPWIAFKVLGAGAIHPTEGFKYAFDNGADFIAVGMFDFQVVEDSLIAKQTLSGKLNRQRPWRA